VDGRVEPGHDEKDAVGRMKPGCGETTQGPRRTQKCVGIRWLTPRISTIAIPYRDGSTKARLAAGTAAFLRKPLGDWQFRAFSVRETMVLTGGRSDAAARCFAF
jgi:hypothetical protein